MRIPDSVATRFVLREEGKQHPLLVDAPHRRVVWRTGASRSRRGGSTRIGPSSGQANVREGCFVAVFGIPDDEWGEQVKAAVELVKGTAPSPALADELLAFARARLAGYKVPRSLDFEDTLPRHPSGKLYVRRLRDRYWQGRERKI